MIDLMCSFLEASEPVMVKQPYSYNDIIVRYIRIIYFNQVIAVAYFAIHHEVGKSEKH